MLAIVSLFVFSSAAFADRGAALAQLEALLAQTLPRRLAPTVNLTSITRRGGAAAYTPTVLMHGLGDAVSTRHNTEPPKHARP